MSRFRSQLQRGYDSYFLAILFAAFTDFFEGVEFSQNISYNYTPIFSKILRGWILFEGAGGATKLTFVVI